MTLLEKFEQEHPGVDPESTVFWCCPSDFGYEELTEEALACAEGLIEEERCRRCWNRKVTEGIA